MSRGTQVAVLHYQELARVNQYYSKSLSRQNKNKGLKLHRVFLLCLPIRSFVFLPCLPIGSLVLLPCLPFYLTNLLFTLSVFIPNLPFYLVYLLDQLNLSFASSRPKYHNCQKIPKMVKNCQNFQKISKWSKNV